MGGLAGFNAPLLADAGRRDGLPDDRAAPGAANEQSAAAGAFRAIERSKHGLLRLGNHAGPPPAYQECATTLGYGARVCIGPGHCTGTKVVDGDFDEPGEY